MGSTWNVRTLDVQYPLHDRTIIVTGCGRICIGKRKINLSQAFAGQTMGVRKVDEKIWLVSFMSYDLGFFDPSPAASNAPQIPSELKCWWSQWVGETLQLI